MRPSRLPPAWADDRVRGWLVTGAVTALAAAIRLPALGRPDRLVFDETYYVKDAWTLLHLGYEGQWPDEPNPAFESGDVDGYTDTASYVVHPPVGKWVIALGLRVLGAQDPVGWRLSVAVVGILSVLLLTRIARRLFDSTVLGGVAGLLLAVDGSAIVHSRIAVLDGILGFFVLAAFGALLIDRDLAVRRLLGATGPPRAPSEWGPSLGARPWRIVAGVLLGLAIGTKWSALWFVVVLGLLTVGWDAAARRRARVRLWWQAALVRDALPAFLSIVPVAALTYLAGWTSWLRGENGYGRRWAAQNPGQGVLWLPDPLRSLLHYHQDMWRFHTNVTKDHPFESHPLGWVFQWRPTAFYYVSPEPPQQYCGADACSQAVTSVGNPLLWWIASVALVACLWWVVRRRDGVAVAVLSGVAAGWLPWFAFSHRTIFAFYAIAFLPWLVLAVTYAAARLLRWGEADPWSLRRPLVRTVVVVLAVLVLATSVYFYPLWTGQVITFRSWQLHQWLPSWN
ncbi:MAG: glycosyl transferase family 39 [Actinotalea sp.]|nr:glycosyl transferase family 39 [Actinotalea sp.]